MRARFGGEAIEADGSVLEAIEGEQDGNHLCSPLLRPMGTLLEILPLNLDTPPCYSPAKSLLERERISCYNGVTSLEGGRT